MGPFDHLPGPWDPLMRPQRTHSIISPNPGALILGPEWAHSIISRGPELFKGLLTRLFDHLPTPWGPQSGPLLGPLDHLLGP